MAEVTLGRYELSLHDIPATCLVCGRPATQRVTQTFSKRRDKLLGKTLVTMTLDAPLCASHGSHWARRAWFNLAMVVILVASPFLLPMVLTTVQVVFSDILLLAILVLAVVHFDATMIKPTEITHHAITLTNVSPEFVADLEMTRQELPRKDEPDFRIGGGEPSLPSQDERDCRSRDGPMAARQRADDGAFRAGFSESMGKQSPWPK
jgi:hypothetical protein